MISEETPTYLTRLGQSLSAWKQAGRIKRALAPALPRPARPGLNLYWVNSSALSLEMPQGHVPVFHMP